MPYTHRKVGNKDCVYKKGTGKKVGCTTGDVNDYLGALHANVKTEELEELNESLIAVGRDKMFAAILNIKDSIKNNVVNTSDAVKTIIKSIKTGEELTKEQKIKIGNDLKTLLKSLGYGAVFMLPGGSVFIITFNLIKKLMDKKKLNESNKLKGGKSDKLTPKKIADKFDVDVKDVKKQIEYGTCVECEHTDDKEKAKEIATDHVSEFPDYYNRLDKMEKQAEKHWGTDKKKSKEKETMNETKHLIKRLVRENMEQSSINQQIQAELERLGIRPNDAYIIVDNNIQTEGLGKTIKKTYDKFKTYSQAIAKPLIVCSVLAGAVSCQKNNPYVYKFSYHIDKKIDTTQQTTHQGVILTPYSPQEQVGSWYELEDHKLSEQERQAMEEELAAQEKARITGKDYTITDYKLELVGQSKRGDIETTDGYK